MAAIAFNVENTLTSLLLLGATVSGSRRVRFSSRFPQLELIAESTWYAQIGDLRPVVDIIGPRFHFRRVRTLEARSSATC